MPKALLAHPGTQYSFRLACELYRADALSRFHTGIAFTAGGRMARALERMPSAVAQRLASRRVDELPRNLLRLQPAREALSLARMRFGGEAQRILHARNERFQRAIRDRELEHADAVIGFDTASWILAERCKQSGVPLILDQSIAHPDSRSTLFEALRHAYPEWAQGIEPRRPEVRLAEQVEHTEAAVIVAASSFTRQTLIDHGVSSTKIRLNAYGVDAERFAPSHASRARPFRFLFVGSVTARKGIPLLLQAWRRLKRTSAELWIVGPASRRAAALVSGVAGVKYLGAVPHAQLPTILRQCDVFVFPSYFEGFGLVILEAMASGLPVISTTATAAPDIYAHGSEGWIVAPGDMEQLLLNMEMCLTNPRAVEAARREARAVAERFSWNEYRRRWVGILHELLGMVSPHEYLRATAV